MADHIEHDIDELEKQLRTAIAEMKTLVDGGLLEAVIDVIHLPGWTSTSEFVFATAMTQALIEHAALVRRLQGGLLAGARRVATEDPPA